MDNMNTPRSTWHYQPKFPLATMLDLAQQAADSSDIEQHVERHGSTIIVKPNPTKVRIYRG